ncbi:MAG TPA: desulfoferrodoxin [Clostridia bacterium]|nr:desulfoferrodoxin [Clostridia bacterium]
MKEILFYRCEKCGNIVALLKKGGGTLSCCGQDMTRLKENSTDAATEKHVPIVAKDGGKVKVTVGSVAHPMAPEHFIEWIALSCGDRLEIVFLKPGDEPKAEFTCPDGSSCGTAYAYCNLHGLWKADCNA